MTDFVGKRTGQHTRALAVAAIVGLLGACAAGPVPEQASPAIPPAVGPDAGQTIVSIPPFETSGHVAFDAWRTDFADRAIGSGRNPAVVYDILRDLKPLDIYLPEDTDADIGTAAADQAEFSKAVWDYLSTAVSQTRKSNGAEYMASERALFDRIEATYGVDGHVVAAIWGMETNFGGHIGNFDGPETLANMAVEGRRRGLAERELLAAMQIVEQGFASREQLVSGWAGAMGQTQFMPSTYLAHAVDFSGDGVRDVWTSRADALASAANYMKVSGYQTGVPWGVEVTVPVNFDYAQADGTRRPVADWAGQGLAAIRDGGLEAGAAEEARLWLPAGATGPKYLLFKNFDVFLTYNRSNSYALAVGLLGDAIDGRDGPVTPWPTGIGRLSVGQIRQMQAALNQLGFDAGGVDGIAGSGTRAALRRFQAARGLRADGYPTPEMLAYVLSAATPG